MYRVSENYLGAIMKNSVNKMQQRVNVWFRSNGFKLQPEDTKAISENIVGNVPNLTPEIIAAAIDKMPRCIYVNFTNRDISIESHNIGTFTLPPSGLLITVNIETSGWDSHGIRVNKLHSVIGLPVVSVRGVYCVVTPTALQHGRLRDDIVAPSTTQGVKRKEGGDNRGRIVSYPGFYRFEGK